MLFQLLIVFLFSTSFVAADNQWDTLTFYSFEMERVPIASDGRFLPLEVFARKWLYGFYHHEKVIPKDRAAFFSQEGSAIDLLWKVHFFGHHFLDDVPLFWIGNADLKKALGLDSNTYHFSYHTLQKSFFQNSETNFNVLRPVLIHSFLKKYRAPFNRSFIERHELFDLSKGLWLGLEDNKIVLEAAPPHEPWNFLSPGMVLATHAEDLDVNTYKVFSDDVLNLLSKLKQYSQPHGLLKVLPSKQGQGLWLSLETLKNNNKALPSNFTLYSDDAFKEIEATYFALEKAVLGFQRQEAKKLSQHLASLLNHNYEDLAGTPFLFGSGKTVSYPSVNQLQAEIAYYHYPFIPILIFAYLFSGLMIFLPCGKRVKQMGMVAFFSAFALQTFILGLRCYILERPPVSNMFETIIYVPWVSVLTGITLFLIFRNRLLILVSSLSAVILLLTLQLTELNGDLENVQPVLNSQYWLIVHVLMVVGSYGAFILSGCFGHLYLLQYAAKRVETAHMKFIGKCIVQLMYLGVALLIPGTILGGVWAAESWGRFWDWDPKESWAFISICIYLIWIHAYTFRHINHFGVAVGSVLGLLAISFTWYGVNYILGTGLHSYGFGSGGEWYYYFFMSAEFTFLMWVASLKKKDRSIKYTEMQ